MRILVVEDDPRIHQPLAEDLRRQHYSVDVAENGLTGLDFARTNVHDVVLLDILLPGLDGLDLCRRLRSERCKAAIVMITARGEVGDKVRALDAGADDYVVKPFDLAELSARIRAASRRQRAQREPTLEHGALRLDPSRRLVTHDGARIALTGTEYIILQTLMQNPLQVFSHGMLREKITTFHDEGGGDSIRTHMANLRRKLRLASGRRDPIENVYGLGYRLAELDS
jgi:two-component system response regulator QseB